MSCENGQHLRIRTFLILWSPSQSLFCEIHSINSVNPVWRLVPRPAPSLSEDDLAEPLHRLQQPVRPDAPDAGQPRGWAGEAKMGDLRMIGYRHLVDVFGRCSSPWLLQSKLDLSSGNPIWPLHIRPRLLFKSLVSFERIIETCNLRSRQNWWMWMVTNWAE